MAGVRAVVVYRDARERGWDGVPGAPDSRSQAPPASVLRRTAVQQTSVVRTMKDGQETLRTKLGLSRPHSRSQKKSMESRKKKTTLGCQASMRASFGV